MIGTLEIWYRDPRGYERHNFTIGPGAGFELDLAADLSRSSDRVVKIKVTGPPVTEDVP